MAKGFRLEWRGGEVEEAVLDLQANAMADIGERIVRYARAQLYPGHGYLTGDLYRSLYCRLQLRARTLSVEVGSPLDYALWVHQGHHSFPGYHFFWVAFDMVRPWVPVILRMYELR